ncbi:MAG TPA: hypothetical protein VIU61_05985 [Kofleriaceae bacterium]
MRCLVIAIALAGCRDPELVKLEETRAEVCACKTVACGDAAMKKVPQESAHSNHRTQQLARDMLDCLHKLYLQNQPGTEPEVDPETEAEPAGSASGSARP